ncbi:hypothetical protein SKAU_G00110150 [Synaphobranchus kaupii]|uniref:Uncharacterized protein n=1 Tax=Synaphobranchus kaupii TaxID=118154 RepID=A0A9Q1G0X9_SYNKA|nr:hypothetical protein SKAU_G00110150 [Synaphobranchus kaupii]
MVTCPDTSLLDWTDTLDSIPKKQILGGLLIMVYNRWPTGHHDPCSQSCSGSSSLAGRAAQHMEHRVFFLVDKRQCSAESLARTDTPGELRRRRWIRSRWPLCATDSEQNVLRAAAKKSKNKLRRNPISGNQSRVCLTSKERHASERPGTQEPQLYSGEQARFSELDANGSAQPRRETAVGCGELAQLGPQTSALSSQGVRGHRHRNSIQGGFRFSSPPPITRLELSPSSTPDRQLPARHSPVKGPRALAAAPAQHAKPTETSASSLNDI